VGVALNTTRGGGIRSSKVESEISLSNRVLAFSAAPPGTISINRKPDLNMS
jgi:hypothetical protein